MKKNLLLLLLILSSSFTVAQVNLDSLYKVWEDRNQPDSMRMQAYYDYIWDGYVYSQPDSALILVDRLFQFSNNRSSEKGTADILHLRAAIYESKGDYLNALTIEKESLKIYEKIGNQYGTANSLNSIGNRYYSLGDFEASLDNYQKSLKISQEIKDKHGIANIFGNVGQLYLEIGDTVLALDYTQIALEIYKELGIKEGIANSQLTIGDLHAEKEDYTKAYNYYINSWEIFKEIEDKEGVSIALSNIGKIFYDQKDYTSALDYYLQSLKIARAIGSKTWVIVCLNGIGSTYNQMGNLVKAIEYCDQGMRIAENIGAIVDQKESCECLYDAYKTVGNSAKALFYYEQTQELNDSLKTKETTKKLQGMEFAKQVLADSLIQVEKEIKVEMAHQIESRKKDNNRNIAIGVGLFFLLLSGGFYGRWKYVKKSKNIIEKEKARSENLLLNILPAEIAEELKIKGKADARDFDLASILFTDFKGFTQASEKLTAKELIGEINHCFKAFDHICGKFGIEKIKTIGDAYMAAGGLPAPSEDSIRNTVLAALEMQAFISERIKEKIAKNEIPFEMRLGIHTGPVVAGIVGVKKFQYDIWGDTVNTAARMESSGEIGKVNISEETYKHIKDDLNFSFEARGEIVAKGKGELKMYFVSNAHSNNTSKLKNRLNNP